MEESRVPWASWSLVMKCTHVQLDYCVCMPPNACHELHESTSCTRQLELYFPPAHSLPIARILHISAHYLANNGV